jgi:hypothetical protein
MYIHTYIWYYPDVRVDPMPARRPACLPAIRSSCQIRRDILIVSMRIVLNRILLPSPPASPPSPPERGSASARRACMYICKVCLCTYVRTYSKVFTTYPTAYHTYTRTDTRTHLHNITSYTSNKHVHGAFMTPATASAYVATYVADPAGSASIRLATFLVFPRRRNTLSPKSLHSAMYSTYFAMAAGYGYGYGYGYGQITTRRTKRHSLFLALLLSVCLSGW